jgi:glycosyltransferase involved in cell wall biosynthesis
MIDYSHVPVTIAMPVFNGEAYMAQALDSLLSQTFTNFELIISDNASSDRTEEIARHYASMDPRIRYYRNDTNLGAGWNQNRVIQLGRGKYFLMAHHDDVRAPEYIERTLAVLAADPSIVVCYTKTQDIDEHGNPLPRTDPPLDIDSHDRVRRFCEIIRMDHICEAGFGLIRMDVLRKTVMHGNYADSDRVLLAELALYGRLFQIPECLFFRRAHAKQSTEVCPDRQSRTAQWFNPQHQEKIFFPHVRQFVEYLRVIHRVPISVRDRKACLAGMLKWLRVNRRRIVYDLRVAAFQVLRKGWRLAFGT